MKKPMLFVSIMAIGLLQSGCHDDDNGTFNADIEAVLIDPTGRWDTENPSPTGLVFNDTTSGSQVVLQDAFTMLASEYVITSISQTQISGDVVEYSSDYYVANTNLAEYNPATQRTGTFVGEVVGGTAMKLTTTFLSGEIVVSDYVYSPLSTSAAVHNGVWTGITETRAGIALSIGTNVFDGSDGSCTYNGTVQLKNPAFNNIYVLATITGCPSAGEYHGTLQLLTPTKAILSLIDETAPSVKLIVLNNYINSINLNN